VAALDGDLTATVARDLVADVTMVTLVGRLTPASVTRVRQILDKCLVECPTAVVADLRAMQVESATLLTVFPTLANRNHDGPDVAVLVCAEPSLFEDRLVAASLGRVLVCYSVESAFENVAASRRIGLRAELVLPPELDAPAQARSLVDRMCGLWELPQVVEPGRLIASELVTNAIRHTGTTAYFEMALRQDYVHFRVRDGDVTPPPIPASTPVPGLGLGGRGLYLVQHYSSATGFAIGEDGKVVWATVRHRPMPGMDVAGPARHNGFHDQPADGG
jgi:anti-sigma regulatory factor (Ser/Thr protein kinase)